MKTIIQAILLLYCFAYMAIGAETTRRVQVIWDAAPVADAVQTYRLSVNGVLVAPEIPGTATNYTLDVTIAKAVFALVAVNEGGESVPATATLPAVPSAPGGFKVTKVVTTVTTSKTTTQSAPK